MKKILVYLIPTISILLVRCGAQNPSIIEVVVPYVNDSGGPMQINIYVRYETTSPSDDTVYWAGGSSDGSPVFGASEPMSGSTSSRGIFKSDFFGEPMFNITVPGTLSGRNAGVIRRKIPAVTETDEQTTYKISQICDPLYDSLNMCQTQTVNNIFSGSENQSTPQGIASWKRIYLSWKYWNTSGQVSFYLPPAISVNTLPPPDPQVCHSYSYKTPGCWFEWFWGEEDCYFWCDSCYSTGQYCDPVTYSF